MRFEFYEIELAGVVLNIEGHADFEYDPRDNRRHMPENCKVVEVCGRRRVIPHILQRRCDLGHQGVEGQPTAPVRGNDLQLRIRLDEAHDGVGGRRPLPRIGMSQRFARVDQEGAVAFSQQPDEVIGRVVDRPQDLGAPAGRQPRRRGVEQRVRDRAIIAALEHSEATCVGPVLRVVTRIVQQRAVLACRAVWLAIATG